MEYTIKEQMMITNFNNLYILALANEMGIENESEFEVMKKSITPFLEETVRDFKNAYFKDEEMDETFGTYTTGILTERFSTDKLCEIIDIITTMDKAKRGVL